MTIPIHLKYADQALAELAPGQIRYVLARDGVYLERRTQLYTTTTFQHRPELDLEPHANRCALHCGKIPVPMVRAMLAFFAWAYQRYRGEAALLLLCHPQTGRLRWYCPWQTVQVYRSLGVLHAVDTITFDIPLQIPDGYVILGDAHSHGAFAAVPSYIDQNDETYKDGLHLIVGQIHRPGKLEYYADFVMDGHRFNVAPADILAEVCQEPYAKVPRSWLMRIRLEYSQPLYLQPNSASPPSYPYAGDIGKSSNRKNGNRGYWS